jgi:DNA (cytosine-5)-methyltransferase 1
MGYARAGFEVVGVDIKPQPHYPFEFHQADALAAFSRNGKGFDVVHASPPCQAFSSLHHRWDTVHPDLVALTRSRLQDDGLPYVIENVRLAPLIEPVMLCGSMFGLGAVCRDGQWRYLRRHRYFEVPWLAFAMLEMDCAHDGQALGVYGTGSSRLEREHNGYQGLSWEREAAMGIDWMTKAENAQAIPPAYTEWIGTQLLVALKAAA